MAASRTLHVTLRARRSPELCTTCWTPALIETTAVWLTNNGVNETRAGTICNRCAEESADDER